MNETKICLLGGDIRQTTLAHLLSQTGYETAIWGIPFPKSSSKFSGVKCSDPASAVKGSRAVILPLPASRDGVRVHCSQVDEVETEARQELRLTQLMELLRPDTLLLAGKPGEVLRAMARDGNIRLIDYYDCEEIQIKNAIPTVEGAIALAMDGLPITLYGAQTIVLGYGRIGQRLATVLTSLGAHVTVAARGRHALTWAKIAGCKTELLSDFPHVCSSPDVIFNTIPAPILTKETLSQLPAHTIIIDLASAPGGVETSATRTCKQKIVRATSLPGQVAPESAGKILYETIYRILTEEGVIPT